jgi:hypothetical protein
MTLIIADFNLTLLITVKQTINVTYIKVISKFVINKLLISIVAVSQSYMQPLGQSVRAFKGQTREY